MLCGSASSNISSSAAPVQRARSLGIGIGAPRPTPSAPSIAPASRKPKRERRLRRGRDKTRSMASAATDDGGDSARAPSPHAPSAAAPNVAELVMLLKIDPDEDANAVLDELWSAQYLAPGTLCAFAGETTEAKSGGEGQGDEAGGGTAAAAAAAAAETPSSSPSPVATDFTHALHMRFANAAAAAAFIGSGAFSAAAERASRASEGEGSRPPLLAVFSGRVDPPSLETLFRRGPEWESGIEHVLLLRATSEGSGGGSGDGDAEAEAAAAVYVSQLRELAESSLVGALQSTSGSVSPSAPPPSLPHPAATHAILTRFAGPEQLRAFLALPPVAVLLSPPPPSPAEGEGGGSASPPPPAPVRAVASAQYSIAPAQGVTGRQGA